MTCCSLSRSLPTVVAMLGGVVVGCAGESQSNEAPPPPPADVVTLAVAVDAGVVTGALSPLWRDHYDLSYTHFNYAAEPGFIELVDELEPRSWRCSVGRWEVGFPPPAGGDSLDPALLRVVDREFYRGTADLAAADNPANYDFTYLDTQLAELVARGAEPLLCFDYMPFTLSSEQDPSNASNLNVTEPRSPYATLSFSNGIRTAPPQDPAVYGRVVRNVIRHVRGLFAGSTDFGVVYFEVGNEPDLFDAGQPTNVFWTGDRTEWEGMYRAIAAEVDADASIRSIVKLGGGSFAFIPNEPQPLFASDVLAGLAASSTRLDFISFHTYSDDPNGHLAQLNSMFAIRSVLGLASADLVNGEWGRALGGVDPVYDTIEHAILRVKAIMLMEVFGVTVANEAIFRNPGTMPGELGLVRTGPPAHKPVSLCYTALNAMNGVTTAVDVTAPTGTFVMAGRSPTLDQCAIAMIVDEPAAGTVTNVQISLTGLPWGSAELQLVQTRVINSSLDVETRQAIGGSGDGVMNCVDVAVGEAGLYVWRLMRM